MMSPIPAFAFCLFVACQLGLVLVGLHRLRLVLGVARHPVAPGPAPLEPALLPTVAVQLPIHNERCVVRRVIEAVAGLDYPAARLEIQVLDDSTDETTLEAECCAAELRSRGHRVAVLHRECRSGYKAGALEAGFLACDSEFVAVFDADFVPPRDFLRRAMPAFADQAVGLVQARWGHLNESHSLLTRVQAALLDGHFLVEHSARSRAGAFFNFNGTAGVWRRSAIEAAGGWQHDTLTEDLDLSYRAQLRGWKFVYLEALVAPAELPTQMNAFKGQQYRWAKGSVQTARKLLPSVLRSRLPWPVKLEALFHLTGNVSYLLALLPAVLMLPLMWLPDRGKPGTQYWLVLAFLLTTGAFVTYFLAALARRGRKGPGPWLALPAILMVGIGLSLNNARAVLAGLGGRPGEFRRTPKRGMLGLSHSRGAHPYKVRLDRWALGELLLSGYFVFSAQEAVLLGHLEAVPFLVLFSLGFGYVGGLSVLESAWDHFQKPLASNGLA